MPAIFTRSSVICESGTIPVRMMRPPSACAWTGKSGYARWIAERSGSRFRSTVTSSMCDWPLSSHRIRLLVPAAFASTTTWLGVVASASITAGLLTSTRFRRVDILTTTDFPTRIWRGCASGAGGAGVSCPRPLAPPATSAKLRTMPAIFGIPQFLIPLATTLYSPPMLEFHNTSLFALNHLEDVNIRRFRRRPRLAMNRMNAARRSRRGLNTRDQFAQPDRFGIELVLINAVAHHKLNASLRAGKKQLFGVLRRQKECHHIHSLRLALRIRFDLLSGGKHFHILENRLCHRSLTLPPWHIKSRQHIDMRAGIEEPRHADNLIGSYGSRPHAGRNLH